MNNDGTHPNVAWSNTAGGVLINVGDTFKFASSSADGTFTRPDGVYNMVQFHIHSNSEHRVNGRTYAAEFHCKPLKAKNHSRTYSSNCKWNLLSCCWSVC
jgi:carbonic anhydrase